MSKWINSDSTHRLALAELARAKALGARTALLRLRESLKTKLNEIYIRLEYLEGEIEALKKRRRSTMDHHSDDDDLDGTPGGQGGKGGSP